MVMLHLALFLSKIQRCQRVCLLWVEGKISSIGSCAFTVGHQLVSLF